MTTVLLCDLKAVSPSEGGYCNKGGRKFFTRHDLSWSDFLRDGIEGDQLLATGDVMARKVVDAAVLRELADGE